MAKRAPLAFVLDENDSGAIPGSAPGVQERSWSNKQFKEVNNSEESNEHDQAGPRETGTRGNA